MERRGGVGYLTLFWSVLRENCEVVLLHCGAESACLLMFCETDCANRRTTWPRCELQAAANNIKAGVESGQLLDIRAAFLFLETK